MEKHWENMFQGHFLLLPFVDLFGALILVLVNLPSSASTYVILLSELEANHLKYFDVFTSKTLYFNTQLRKGSASEREWSRMVA